MTESVYVVARRLIEVSDQSKFLNRTQGQKFPKITFFYFKIVLNLDA